MIDTKLKMVVVFTVVLFGFSLKADDLGPKFDAAIRETADASSLLGYKYARSVQLFEGSPAQASEACRLLSELDVIRRKAKYQFGAIESQPAMKIMRAGCANHKEKK